MGPAAILRAQRESWQGARVTLGEMFDSLLDRRFGAVLLVFAALHMLPLPWGLYNLLALPVVVLTAARAIGSDGLWLPRRLRAISVSRAVAVRACDAVIARLGRIERVVRPRLPGLATGPAERGVAVGCMVFALILSAPLPVLNWLPAIALILVALGLVEADGVLVLAGLLVGALGVILLAAVIIGLLHLAELTAWSAALAS